MERPSKSITSPKLSTKKQIEWKLKIGDDPSTVLLQLSSLSGKKRIIVDG